MILRTNKDKNNPYVVTHRKWIDDERMSAKAKGIMIYLLSLPDDWKIYLHELKNHFKDGVKSISSGIKELKKLGYITRHSLRDSKGKFEGYEYLVHEVLPETPKTENGKTENGKTENRKRHTTNYSSKPNINNNKYLGKTPSHENFNQRPIDEFDDEKYYTKLD
jgi:hypothetical protein